MSAALITDSMKSSAVTDELRLAEGSALKQCLYSRFHLDKNKDGHLDINPGFLAKGICEDLGFKYVSDAELEMQERKARRLLYVT